MGYKELYDYVQTLNIPVGRNDLIRKVETLTAVKVKSARVDLDLSVCRGMYLTPQNGEHRLVEQMGGVNVIAFGRGLNRCWERFVIIKELMHIFDPVGEMSDTGEKFEELLRGFAQPRLGQRTPQMESEVKCFWRALLVLCPEAQRVDLMARRARGEISSYEVALQLRIPEHYVPWLEDPTFSNTRDLILSFG